ncbi:MAG: GTP-binding protein, partial [Bordetella sp.]|nr:GTP-binding protein [Bordetella sp.]
LHGEGLQLDGQALTGAGSHTLSEPAEINIAGLGRIRVLPGAAELSTLKAARSCAEEQLRALLEGVGAASATEARQQEQAWTDARDEAARLAEVIAGLAPDGVSALADAVRQADGEVQQLEIVLAGMPEPVGQVPTVEAAEAAELATQKAHADAMKLSTSSRAAAAGEAERLRAATEALQASQARVNAPDRAERRRRTGEALLHARAEDTAIADRLAELRATIGQARPELLRADVKRLRASADTQLTKHATDAAELNRLSGLLQAQGALGLAELYAATENDVARLQRLADQYSRDAAALAYLLAVLTAKRDQVARSIRAPLQAHMNHYLGIYQPGMAIELDEQLRPTTIARQGLYGLESGEFEALSGGEREQVGIIARLAYADLLREAGKPTLIVLDDSLVNTDPSRLVDMKRVLFDAAERHQILLLTCHQESWNDIGVAPRALQ